MILHPAAIVETIETSIDAFTNWLQGITRMLRDYYETYEQDRWVKHQFTETRIVPADSERAFPGFVLLARNPYFYGDEGFGKQIQIAVWVEMRDLGLGKVQALIGYNDEVEGAVEIMNRLHDGMIQTFRRASGLKWDHDGETIDDTPQSGSLIKLPNGRYIHSKEVVMPLAYGNGTAATDVGIAPKTSSTQPLDDAESTDHRGRQSEYSLSERDEAVKKWLTKGKDDARTLLVFLVDQFGEKDEEDPSSLEPTPNVSRSTFYAWRKDFLNRNPRYKPRKHKF